jgi:hypothetical protein
MRQVVPSGDFPSNVVPAKFTPPEGMGDEVGEAVGLIHKHPDTGETLALEFMFELTEQDIRVLKHEPYLTLTFMTDRLHPFAIQTSYPYDEKYENLDTHTHICRDNLAHEDNQWWKCDNPRHDHIKDRIRECTPCWRARTQEGEPEGGDPPVEPVP